MDQHAILYLPIFSKVLDCKLDIILDISLLQHVYILYYLCIFYT